MLTSCEAFSAPRLFLFSPVKISNRRLFSACFSFQMLDIIRLVWYDYKVEIYTTNRNFAIKSQEFLIEGYIPPGAITII